MVIKVLGYIDFIYKREVNNYKPYIKGDQKGLKIQIKKEYKERDFKQRIETISFLKALYK